jgi:hypothetical protein
MNWESRSNKNLFGWHPASSRPRSLTILRSWPELKLGPLVPGIMVLNGGANGPWYVVTERRQG